MFLPYSETVEVNIVLELIMLKLILVFVVTFVSVNTFADKRRLGSDDSSYERCLKRQNQGYKIKCNKPPQRETSSYDRCLELQERGHKIRCIKDVHAQEERESGECVISQHEETTTKTCHGETWVKVTARPDGTVGETEEVEGLEVVDIPADVQDYLEGELEADEYIADTETEESFVTRR